MTNEPNSYLACNIECSSCDVLWGHDESCPFALVGQWGDLID